MLLGELSVLRRYTHQEQFGSCTAREVNDELLLYDISCFTRYIFFTQSLYFARYVEVVRCLQVKLATAGGERT